MRPQRIDHKQRKMGAWKLVIAGQEDPCSDPEWITPSRSCPARPRSCPARPVPWGDAQATSVLESFGCTFELIFWAHAAGLVLAPLSTPAGSFFYFYKICLPLTLDFPCSLLVLFCARRLFYANRHPQGAPGIEQGAPGIEFSRLTRDGLGVSRGGGWGGPVAHLAGHPFLRSQVGRPLVREPLVIQTLCWPSLASSLALI